MDKLIEKAYLIFLISIPIIILFGMLARESVLDINIHDTYFVIAYLHLAIVISILFAIIGMGYWLMQKMHIRLSKWLIWIHTAVTFGGAIIIIVLVQFYKQEIMEYEFNDNLTLTIMLLILLMVLVQIIFPINLLYGLIKKKK